MADDALLGTALADAGRLAALRRTGLLDTPPEEAFDRLARLVCRLLGVPAALVSLVEADRQFFKSAFGLPEPWATRRETPLSHSFCQHVVATSAPLVLDDAPDEVLRDLEHRPVVERLRQDAESSAAFAWASCSRTRASEVPPSLSLDSSHAP